jgi:hypothetical protein
MHYRTLLPSWGGLRCATCPTTPDLASLQGMVLKRRVSYSSGSCLLVVEGSGVSHVIQLRIMPLCNGGLCSVACFMAPDPAFLPGGLRCRHRMPCDFLWTVGLRYINKGLASLPMQLGTRAYSICAWRQSHHGSERCVDMWRHHNLQDVWTGRLQCGYSTTPVTPPSNNDGLLTRIISKDS